MAKYFLFSVAVFMVALGAGSLVAQETKYDKKDETKSPAPPEDKKYEIPFFIREAGLSVQASMHCFGSVTALGAVNVRLLAGDPSWMPREWRIEFTEVFPLSSRNLERILDDRPLPNVVKTPFLNLPKADQGFYLAYIEAHLRSQAATEEMFRNSAEPNKGVVYSHLASSPGRHRGKIVTVKGTMIGLEEEDAPLSLRSRGILKIYMARIKAQHRAPVFAALFSELPIGVTPAPDMEREVTFQGYFLANVSFPSGGPSNKGQSHPYFVGKTIAVHKKEKRTGTTPPEEESTSTSYPLIVTMFAGFAGVVFLGVFLNFMLRRADRRTQSQLASVRDKHQPFSLGDDTDAENLPEANDAKLGKES